MAEAPPPAIAVPGDVSETVIVETVTESGGIEFASTTRVNPVIQLRDVKVPIPHPDAYQLVRSTLVGNVLRWKQLQGEALEYNIFFNPITGNNVLYAPYGNIVGMLKERIRLPEVGQTGTCRISPVCTLSKLYVQPRPAYVDTVAYMIYLAMDEKIRRNLIRPAQDIAVGKVYVYSECLKHYRVRLLKRLVETEPIWFQAEMRNRVRRERQKFVSIGCAPGDVDSDPSSSKGSRDVTSGEKRNDSDEEFPRFQWSERDLFDRKFGEMVKVFRVDYGGPPMIVHRADLYNIESVYAPLEYIQKLVMTNIFQQSMFQILSSYNGLNCDSRKEKIPIGVRLCIVTVHKSFLCNYCRNFTLCSLRVNFNCDLFRFYIYF